jgi:hypothetical protein
MTTYKVQHWPDMPGDGGEGDALVYSTKWEPKLYERHKSWEEAWAWIAGNIEPGDKVKVKKPKSGYRDASY